MRAFFIFFIQVYRKHLSVLFPPSCRFVPTCSEYALQVFSTKSTPRALWMTIVRILKCNPWHRGGFDPVR